METLKVCGHSMFPTLRNGSEVLLKKAPSSQITKRDIIVFRRNSQLVCHRVIGIFSEHGKKTVFRAKGDFNFKLTERVSEDDVIGKVVGVFYKEKLKPLRFEKTFLYCLATALISFAKEALRRLVMRKPSIKPEPR